MDDEPGYTNPVYGEYLADPFVLKYNGEYYAYGTVPLGDCALPVLHSRDLVHWQRLGDALAPVAGSYECFWAPEVAYDNGVFYMYFSAGGVEGEGHQLHVATATHPAGPFHDHGVLTPDEPFTIDAHPFRDDDGQWYLFYCVDFLEGERVGTGIVVDRLVDMQTLAGEPVTVVRAHAEWNLYQANRHWYGRVQDWYTIEGAFVRKHAGRYFCFYSGGAWREPNYGVACGVADRPLGLYRVETSISEPEILRTIDGLVIGPGHAAIVVAPDNVHDYLVYHAWDLAHTARLMRIDPLNWEASGPSSPGPSIQQQPAPPSATFRDLFDGPRDGCLSADTWQVTAGAWHIGQQEVVQSRREVADARALLAGIGSQTAFLFEANLKHQGEPSGGCGVVASYVDARNFAELLLDPEGAVLHWRCVVDAHEVDSRELGLAALGSGFRADTFHQFLVRRQASTASIHIDGVLLASDLVLPVPPGMVGLVTQRTAATFAGVSITLLSPQ